MSSLADVGRKLLEIKARKSKPDKNVQALYEPLKLSIPHREDEPLWEKVDRYYVAVKTTILNYQSPTTGLFPTKTCSSFKEAKVRDSLYCAASSWALALAYRGLKFKERSEILKIVEQFKQDPSPSKCLQSIFNVDTGDEILSYNDYHHLQIDALSLLYLVEKICSGLHIIYNADKFCQRCSRDYLWIQPVWESGLLLVCHLRGPGCPQQEQTDTVLPPAQRIQIPQCGRCPPALHQLPCVRRG